MSKNNYNSVSDEDLVEYYRNSHDTVYVGELYTRYTHLVYGVCMKYLQNDNDAKDATMQIFEKLLKELKKHHITAFKPWLYMVVKNYCMMEFRKAASQKTNTQKIVKEQQQNVETDVDAHLDEKAEKELMLNGLEKGLSALKPEQQQCVKLFYLEEMSYKDIAEKTGFSLNDVKSHIQNGKRNLKLFLTENKNG
ncbi:MAG: sigma-70 family RNA polymerase sigma factor [Chitinophagales bacterium]|nr:sigma-70 family RNA polymerase sigma factor [Chitinophagales bacterium]